MKDLEEVPTQWKASLFNWHLFAKCKTMLCPKWEINIFKGRLKFPSYFRASKDYVTLFLVNTQQPTRFDVMSSKKQEYSAKDEDMGKKLVGKSETMNKYELKSIGILSNC